MGQKSQIMVIYHLWRGFLLQKYKRDEKEALLLLWREVWTKLCAQKETDLSLTSGFTSFYIRDNHTILWGFVAAKKKKNYHHLSLIFFMVLFFVSFANNFIFLLCTHGSRNYENGKPDEIFTLENNQIQATKFRRETQG